MSLQVEKMEKNMAKLTIEVSAEELEKAIQGAYIKNKGKISVPGFRKGKAPRVMIEKMYGVGVFYEDAANALIPEAYSKAVDESKLDVVSQPEIDVTQLEKGQSFIFTAEVALKPEVTLGDYKGIEIEKADLEVKEEEIETKLKQELESNSRTVEVDDRAVADGDILTLDFEGFVDGVAFEGGKGVDSPLVIGSHSFIPGFEEGLIGAEIDKEIDVNVTFPEDYQSAELAGKPAVFKCTVKGIKAKELPELDDEFAKDVSEFDTLAEYKEDIKAKLAKTKEEDAKRAKEDAVVDKIIANASMEIPEPMIASQMKQMVEDFGRRMQSQGLSLEQYFQFTGLDAAKLEDQMRPQALKRIQSRLVLEKIAEIEAIEIPEDKLDAEIKTMAEMYQMEADKLKELMGDYEKEQMKKDMAVQEAVTFVSEAAVEV